MAKQARFLCIGGFLNGSALKDQGESFECIEKSKKITYRKLQISHPDVWEDYYYVCETTTDKQATNWVYDVKN